MRFQPLLALGVAHISGGADHVLCLFGLLLLVSGARVAVRTVTAFTIGHSLTLSLAAFGLANVAPFPVELLIAASVLILAVELARQRGSPPGPAHRHPEWMACAFGLLHGLGFAGALAEVGLPPEEIPLALFAFNCGIELGQLGFALAFAVVAAALRSLPVRLPSGAARVPAYAMGSAAAYWCFERAAALIDRGPWL